jgi:hypothetical protein
MPVIHILGLILPPPPFIDITCKDMPTVNFKPEGTGLDIAITIKMSHSLIDIECNVNRFVEDDIGHILKITVDLARAAVNLVGFMMGYGLIVHMHTLVRPDGTRTVLLPQNPQLAAVCTAFSLKPSKTREENDMNTVASIVFADPQLFIALDDLIGSQIIPHSIPINCGRVVEAIRHMISPALSGKRDEGWQAMRSALRLDRSYLQMTTDNSKGGRHGDRSFISGPVTLEIQKRAWTIMNRFLEFRKRNNQPLPVDEFPVLS